MSTAIFLLGSYALTAFRPRLRGAARAGPPRPAPPAGAAACNTHDTTPGRSCKPKNTMANRCKDNTYRPPLLAQVPVPQSPRRLLQRTPSQMALWTRSSLGCPVTQVHDAPGAMQCRHRKIAADFSPEPPTDQILVQLHSPPQNVILGLEHFIEVVLFHQGAKPLLQLQRSHETCMGSSE